MMSPFPKNRLLPSVKGYEDDRFKEKIADRIMTSSCSIYNIIPAQKKCMSGKKLAANPAFNYKIIDIMSLNARQGVRKWFKYKYNTASYVQSDIIIKIY